MKSEESSNLACSALGNFLSMLLGRSQDQDTKLRAPKWTTRISESATASRQAGRQAGTLSISQPREKGFLRKLRLRQ